MLRYVGNQYLQTFTLGAGYVAGSGTMTLTAGQGARLPAFGNFYVRQTALVVPAQSALLNILKVTARAGDVLTVVGGVDGTTDQNIAINSEMAWVLSASGMDELFVNPGTAYPIFKPYSVAYTDLTAAADVQDIVLFQLPVFGKLIGVTIKHSASFSAPGLTALTVEVGSSADPIYYAGPFDIAQAAGNTVFLDAGNYTGPFTMGAADNVVARFTSTGALLNTLTVGAVAIWVGWVTLPNP